MSQLTRSSFSVRAAGIVTAARPLVPTMEKIEANSSASQHKTFKRCHRLWWFEKVVGVKQRAQQHFIIGTVLHGVAERYITGQTKTWDDLFPVGWNEGLNEYESNWARRMASKAVENGTWQAIENSYIEFPIAFLVGKEHVDARGLPLLAKAETYIDEHKVRRVAKLTTLYDGSPLPPGWSIMPPYVGFIDHLRLWENPPKIADHKTSKNRTYATTPAKLAEDLQVLSYAAVPMVIRPEVTEVDLIHNLFLKNEGGPDPYVVKAVAPFAKVLKTWESIRSNSEEMLKIRAEVPKVVDASNPYARGNNWQRVRSAIEEGRPDACKEYSGCPFKDVCFGRATAEQVLRRMDSPDPMELVKRAEAKPEPIFGLRGRPPPVPKPAAAQEPVFGLRPIPAQNLTQPIAVLSEPLMPFAPKPLAVNQDIYIVDPEDATTQYRARIVEPGNVETVLALYPNADVAPDFGSLGTAYRISVPKELVLTIPHPTAKVKGYQETLVALGMTQGSEWTAAPAAATPTVAATTKPSNKPERDGAFGLKGAPAVAAPAQTPAATLAPAPQAPAAVPVTTSGTIASPVPVSPPAPAGPVPAATVPKAMMTAAHPTAPIETMPTGTPAWALAGVPNGTQLQVKASTHPFWSTLVGKIATVTNSAPGELPGSTYVAFVMDGVPYPEANVHRFEPLAAAPVPVVDVSNVPMTQEQRAFVLKGQIVSIVLHSTLSQYNCVLDDVTAEGIVYLGGRKALWSDVKSLDAMTEAAIPGAPPTKEQKAAAREAAKVEKAAAKEAAKAAGQQAVPGTEAVPSIEPGNALDAALEAVQAVLNGGKVTRKALEGILPLLQAAKVHQDNLESLKDSADEVHAENLEVRRVVAAGGMPPPQNLGLLRVAIDHAISTLTDARAKIDA